MKTVILFVLLALANARLWADDVAFNLIAPTATLVQGSEVTVAAVWLNTGVIPADVEPPAVLEAKLRGTSEATWSVKLRNVSEVSTQRAVLEPGRFAQRAYAFNLPTDAGGPLVLSIENPRPARALLEVEAGETVAPAVFRSGTTTSATALRPVASRLHRTVTENFGFHEPIYFLYGPDEPVAKFQLSFRYRIAGHRESPVESDPAAKGVYVAYTQRSLWNIKEPSSPFYDSSYMPEIMFESLAPERPDGDRLVSFIGYQAGYRHESNGRDGLESRSLDIVYVRTGVLIGRRSGWRALIVPRVFAYLSESSDNPDIDEYRGNGELLLSLGREDGIQLNITGSMGRDLDKGSIQLDLTHPIKIPSVNFDTFLHAQYFNGYGESLRDYNRKSSTWRAGFSLVR